MWRLRSASTRERSGAGEDGVEVVIEDDPGVDLQALVRAAVLEGADEDVAARRRGEDRQPGDDGAGDEVRLALLEDAVTAAHGQAQSGEV